MLQESTIQQQRITHLEAEIQSLTTAQASSQETFDIANKAKESLQFALSEAQGKLRNNDSQLAGLRAECEEQKTQLDSASEKLRESEALRNELDEAHMLTRQLSKDLEAARISEDTLSRKADSLAPKLEGALTQLSESQETIATLEAQCKMLEEEKKRNLGEQITRNDQLLQNQISEREQSLHKVSEELAALQSRCQDLENQLAQYGNNEQLLQEARAGLELSVQERETLSQQLSDLQAEVDRARNAEIRVEESDRKAESAETGRKLAVDKAAQCLQEKQLLQEQVFHSCLLRSDTCCGSTPPPDWPAAPERGAGGRVQILIVEQNV